jgi:hypothetical protein
VLIVHSDEFETIHLFNFDKCLTPCQLLLIEPVDILFHCSILVSQSCSKSELDHQPLEELKGRIQLVYKAYLIKSSQEIFEMYRLQTISRIKSLEAPGKSMLILHQLELGLVDALVEHVIINKQYQ